MSLYSPISASVPEDLTKPTSSFKKHLWLSILGLFLFIAVYIGLTIWFGSLAYKLFLDATGSNGEFYHYLLSGGFAFLALFMLKSLFGLSKKERDGQRVYITKEQEPLLFDFLDRLADEAEAPRAHKVFLSSRVNASVSYDLSLLNLLFPTKKNLEIGLGLVNVLSLGEFKAVLAHEFGHFAQRSMLLGRYVYVAQQVAARIVGKRDAFDSFLAGISRIDIRIAWIGWILSILVWSVRCLIEICFSIVVIAERALSREMEFQADLVAASLTGSDALVNALYKLGIADEAYYDMLDCLNNDLTNKKAVKDMFVFQTNYIKNMSNILDNPNYGRAPEIPSDNPALHRVFTTNKYNPPQMWATHPADKDREENLKKVYIPEDIDERSSWELFSDPKGTREKITQLIVATAKVDTSTISEESALANQEKQFFDWTFLKPEYHSNFFNRFYNRSFENIEEIYSVPKTTSIREDDFNELYPGRIRDAVRLEGELLEEIQILESRKYEAVTIERRPIVHRGERIKRSEIDDVLKALRGELEDVRTELADHDSKCRRLHYFAAKELGGSNSEYLKNMARLVHYAEHNIANLQDSKGKLDNVLAFALADGNVSDKELTEIIRASDDLYFILKTVFHDSEAIGLDRKLSGNMGVAEYGELLEEFKLGKPYKDTINQWLEVIDGWVNVALSALQKLRNEALELLLESEGKVKRAYLDKEGLNLGSPSGLITPQKYDTLVYGKERKRVNKLTTWDRFIIGDGVIPSVAKFGVSGGILALALFVGSLSREQPLYVYNGLQTEVVVKIGEKEMVMSPNSKEILDVKRGESYNIVTHLHDGTLVEEFKGDISSSNSIIYNVAESGVMYEYEVAYSASPDPNFVPSAKALPLSRWMTVKSDYVFNDPPETIELPSSNGSVIKTALVPLSEDPNNFVGLLETDQEREAIIGAHCLWDDHESINFMDWTEFLGKDASGEEIMRKRLLRNGKEVLTYRALLNMAGSKEKEELCGEFIKLQNENSEDPDYFYLMARCNENGESKDDLYIDGAKRWPDHFMLARAAVFSNTQDGNWKEAYDLLETIYRNHPGKFQMLATDAERIKRMVHSKGLGDVQTIFTTEAIEYNDMLEADEWKGHMDGPEYTYFSLHKGKLDEAWQLAESQNDSDYLKILISGSTGADDQMKDIGLELGGMEGQNLIPHSIAMGLAIQREMELSSFKYRTVQLLGLDEGLVDVLIENIRTGNVKELEKALGDSHYMAKAAIYLSAIVANENTFKKELKSYVNSILLASERPYIE